MSVDSYDFSVVASQVEHGSFGISSFEATRVGWFMRLSLLTLTSVKVEKDNQGFLDEIEKIIRVMHAMNVEGVEFVVYQLKDVAYQWYEEWD